MFFSMLDPSSVCSYVSEVHDGGLIGPVFKVLYHSQPCFEFLIISEVLFVNVIFGSKSKPTTKAFWLTLS